jgi:hypothetical protein
MRKLAVLLIFLALVMPSLVQAAERPATKAEIQKIAVGHLVSNAMYYGADGKYTYKGGSPGRYQVSDGRICVVFDSGQNRCDQILKDGDAYFLITAQGRRSPFIPN